MRGLSFSVTSAERRLSKTTGYVSVDSFVETAWIELYSTLVGDPSLARYFCTIARPCLSTMSTGRQSSSIYVSLNHSRSNSPGANDFLYGTALAHVVVVRCTYVLYFQEPRCDLPDIRIRTGRHHYPVYRWSLR